MVCMYACMYVCMCIYMCMYLCMYVCMYVCMYICVCIMYNLCMYNVYVCMTFVCAYVCMHFHPCLCFTAPQGWLYRCMMLSVCMSSAGCNRGKHGPEVTEASHKCVKCVLSTELIVVCLDNVSVCVPLWTAGRDYTCSLIRPFRDCRWHGESVACINEWVCIPTANYFMTFTNTPFGM